MLFSPFQQPSPRQNALAFQIQEARTSGDEALLEGLICQWVHRYGFNGTAELDLSLPEPAPAPANREFSHIAMPVEEEEIAAEDEALVENEAVAQDEMVVEEEEIAAEDEVLVENEAVAQDEMVVEEEEIAAEDEALVESEAVAQDEMVVEEEEIAAEETEPQRSFSSAPLPPPPISTPRSLRRWLPRRDGDAFPNAS